MRSIRRPRSRSPASAALIDIWADLHINLQTKVGLYVGQRASTAHKKGLRGTVTWFDLPELEAA